VEDWCLDAIDNRLGGLGVRLPAPMSRRLACRCRSSSCTFTAGSRTSRVTGLSTATNCSSAGGVGAEVSVEQAYDAAHPTALSILASLKHEFGDLDRVTGSVRALGFVAARRGSPDAGRDQWVQRFDPVPVGRCRAPRAFSDRRGRTAVRHAGRGRSGRRGRLTLVPQRHPSRALAGGKLALQREATPRFAQRSTQARGWSLA
jgi:hypothetical protein